MKMRSVAVELFLHIEPARKLDPHRHIRAEVANFFATNWTFGEPHPRIYYAPHTLDVRTYGNLHAKCVVVDERVALVGSANFTSRGQERNIEVGARIESPRFARDLVAQFHGAMSAGVFVAFAE